MYSTCSIFCEENECLVAWTLEKYPEMELVSADPVVGGPGFSGVRLFSIILNFKLRNGIIDTLFTVWSKGRPKITGAEIWHERKR